MSEKGKENVSEVIDAPARPVARVDESALVRRSAPAPAPATLWRTDDPEEVVKRATKAANALASVIREKGMVTSMGGGREHVNIEGWQTLASMVGLVSARPWTRVIEWPADEHLTETLREIRDKGYVFGFDAGYAALTLDGREVGGGEGTCKRTEEAWCLRRGKVVDDYALKGMALTRAQSRAFAAPLRFVVELAGFKGTPAEEVDGVGPADREPAETSTSGEPSQKQLNLIKRLVKENGANEKEGALVRRWAKARLTPGREGTASALIARLQDDDEKKRFDTAQDAWRAATEWQGAEPKPKQEEIETEKGEAKE